MNYTRLNINEALTLYREKTGRTITDNGLFYLAKRNNFIEKAKDNFHYWYLKEKMENYLLQIQTELPVGYKTIKQLSQENNLSYSWANKIICRYKLKSFEYGKRRVKTYNEKEFKKILICMKKKRGKNG